MKRADSILANFYMSKKRPIEDPRGQWDHPGEVTRIPSNKITMQGVPYPVLGVGSNGKKQMMYPGEDYTFNGAKYVDEYPMMQKGGRAPIYTSDKNDPRIKAYNDSLNLYNENKKIERFMKEHGMSTDKTHVFPFSKVTSYGYANRPTGNIKPISAVSQETTPGHPSYYRAEWLNYVKPVQPVLFQERPLKQNNRYNKASYNINQPQINFGAPVPKTIDQYPTNYSVTFRDENSPSKQRTQYFPDLQSWINFTDNAGYMSREQTADGRSAQALGYNQYRLGGGLLSRSVTCSNCGHSWKATDGGIDPLTCHKCGGMIKMKQGGQTKNERDMVNGIADILSQVTDPQNRAQIAQEMVKDFNNEDVTYDYDKFMELSNLKNGGEMIRRADGSYSRRGLWDNIRANKGSGKKPTKQMLEQERKIKRSMQVGGLWNTNRTQWVDSVHNANMNQNFVQRFYLKNGPSIQIPGQPGRSTHFMEESDGMVYPTVVQMPNGKLQYLNLNDKDGAYNYAKKTGQFIKFPTVEQARWYGGNGYKTGTGVTIGKKQVGGDILEKNMVPTNPASSTYIKKPEIKIPLSEKKKIEKRQQEEQQKKLDDYLKNARNKIEQNYREIDSLTKEGLHPFEIYKRGAQNQQLLEILSRQNPKLVNKELNNLKKTGKLMMATGSYLFPEAAPLFNTFNNAVDVVDFIKQPSKDNATMVGLDFLSMLPGSTRSKFNPFTVAGDFIDIQNALLDEKQMGGFVPKYQSKGEVTPAPVYDNIPSPAFLNSETLKNVNFKKERDQRLLKKRQDVYKTIRPSNYDDINNYFRYLFNNQREDMDDPRSEEAFRMYLNLEKNPKYFSKSKYAPTIKGVPGSTYYKVDDELEQDIFNTYSDKVKLNQVLPAYEEAVESYYSEETPGVFRDVPGGKQYIALQPGDENIIFGRPQASRARALGNFVVSKGKDKKGEYLSYSDQYDFPDFFQNEMQGKPFKIYNRIYYPKEQMGGKVAMREYPTMKYGGFLNKYQEKGQVVMTPVYNSLEDFYQRNKNAKTVINNDQVDILKGLSNDISSGKPVIKYCHPDDEQCTARANRMVQSLIPGTSYFENPDVTSKHLGAGYSVARTPTEQEVKKYPYFKGDTQFGSFDAWDIAPTAEVSKPKNVLFNAGKGKTSFEDFQNKRLSFNKLMESYDVPIGSYINTGYKQIDDTTHSGSHTVRVVGYLPTGEPLVADYGFIKPLSESMHTYGNKDEPFIAAITTVPGKEKYNFKYFKDQKEVANKPSDVKYITDFSDKSEDYKKFHDTIAKDKNYVVANLGISPKQYDEYAKLALTLGGHETEFGKGTTYKWLDWLGSSTGVAQLNESNVDEKYKKTLSKYKKGSKEYNALATVLYMNELNKYKDKWFNKGKVAQERPYKRHEIDSRVKELYRNVAQGKSSTGYINSAMDSDEYRDEKGTLELPYKTPFQSDESYKKEVNAFLAKSRPDLRFDYDNKGERVIYKKTQGNKIPNTLKDFVFYAYNTPTTVRYGDAQGDSKYYQKMNEIYTDLFGKKRDGGDISIPELYHVKNPRIKKLF